MSIRDKFWNVFYVRHKLFTFEIFASSKSLLLADKIPSPAEVDIRVSV